MRVVERTLLAAVKARSHFQSEQAALTLVYPVVLLLILTAIQVGVSWYASHLTHAAADTALGTARSEDTTEQQAQQAAAALAEIAAMLDEEQVPTHRAKTVEPQQRGHVLRRWDEHQRE